MNPTHTTRNHSPAANQFSPDPGTAASHGEDGIILIMVIFMAAMLLLALAVAAPVIAKEIQRQREIETIHRGLQYEHAIKLYYKKFGAYPTSIKQLLQTDNIRFLRKKYTDPLTGKDDWRIIHLGQAKVPPMGFFGKPLMGAGGPTAVGTPAGAANSGNFMGGNGTVGGNNGTTGMNGAMGTLGNAGDSNFGGTSNFGSAGFGNSPASTSGNAFGSTTATAGTAMGTATGASAGPRNSLTGVGSKAQSNSDNSSFGSGNSNSAGPIVGVGLPVNKPSIIAWHKQTNYSKWEFVYWPIEDRKAAPSLLGGAMQTMNGSDDNNEPGGGSKEPGGNSNGPGGTNPNSGFGGGNSGFGNNNGFGGGNSGFGGNNGFGGSNGSGFGGASPNPGGNSEP